MEKAMLMVSLTLFALPARAGEAAPATQPGRRCGPLAGLPSVPGLHLAKIKALGDNEWLNLGAPAPDPKWGRAPGRSWCCTMPFDTRLRGAFLYGEGRHGYVKPDGRYMDDCWFYDLNGHRWICVYPGTDVKNPGLTRDAEGFPKKCVNGFYDPDWNVHVFHVAGDSRPDGRIWAYRYKRAEKKPAS